MTDRPLSPGRRRLFAAITAAVGLSVGLAALEVGARSVIAWRRTAAQRPPERLDLLMSNPHGTGSYRLKPHIDLTTRVGAREVRIRTNSHGMPWREVDVESRDGRRRIAFLGDSFTFGCWADDWEHAFPAVFEGDVSQRLWEVMSFGVGGYGLADEELLLREEVARFGVDYVIVAMFDGNDLRDTWLGLHKERLVRGTAELDDAVVKERVPASDLVRDTTTSQPCEPGPIRRWFERSAAFQMAAPLLGFENQCLEFAANHNFTQYSYWSQHPYPPVARDARDATLATLARMDAFLWERGARLAIATIPTREQVHARVASGRGYDTDLPQGWIRVFARERGIPFLDLLPTLREHVLLTNDRVYVAGDTHLNDLGHEIVGRRMADWFRCCVKNHSRPEPPATP